MDQDDSSNIASTADAPQMHIFARLPGMTGGFQVLTRYADAVADMARYAMLESGTSSILAVLIPNLEADEFQEAVRTVARRSSMSTWPASSSGLCGESLSSNAGSGDQT